MARKGHKLTKIHQKEGKRPVPDWIKEYLLEWIEKLILNEWHISAYVNGYNEDEDSYAQVAITRATQRASIRYRGDLPEERPEDATEWELTTIHELLHVRFANLAYCAIDDIMIRLSNEAYAVAYSSFDTHLEQLIELMANILHNQAKGE